MAKSPSKLIINFLKDLDSAKESSAGGSRYYIGYNKDKLVSAILGLDSKALKGIVKDSHWDRYPTYSNSRQADMRHLGPAILRAVNLACRISTTTKEILISNSAGIFLIGTIESTYGSDKIKACRRAIKSKDQRARLRASRELPVSAIKWALTDKAYSVRNMAIKRFGMANCANLMADDSDSWIRGEAIKNLSPTDDRVVAEIERLSEELTSMVERGSRPGWHSGYQLAHLVGLQPSDRIPYYLNLSTISEELGEIIGLKLDHWGSIQNDKQGSEVG